MRSSVTRNFRVLKLRYARKATASLFVLVLLLVLYPSCCYVYYAPRVNVYGALTPRPLVLLTDPWRLVLCFRPSRVWVRSLLPHPPLYIMSYLGALSDTRYPISTYKHFNVLDFYYTSFMSVLGARSTRIRPGDPLSLRVMGVIPYGDLRVRLHAAFCLNGKLLLA